MQHFVQNDFTQNIISQYLSLLCQAKYQEEYDITVTEDQINNYFIKYANFLSEIHKRATFILKSHLDTPTFLRIISHAPKFNDDSIFNFLLTLTASSDPFVRQYAARTILLQMDYDNKKFNTNLFSAILFLAFFDESNQVRECILNAFPPESHRWLSDNETVINLVSLINDPSEQIRAAALNLLIKVAKLNPFVILPQLRHALLNDIYIFTSKNQTFDYKAQRARSFSLLLHAALPILPAYSHLICDAILRMLSLQNDEPGREDEVEKLKIILTKTVRHLANVAPLIIEDHVTQFVEFLICLLPQTSSLVLTVEIVKTLYALFKQSKTLNSTKTMSDDSLVKMFSYLTVLATKYKNEELTVEIFRLMGCIGALEETDDVQSEVEKEFNEQQQKNQEDDTPQDKEKYCWSTICNILTEVISTEKDPLNNSLAVSALVHIFCDTVLVTSVFDDFMISFISKIEAEKGNYYLDQLILLCVNIPYCCQRFGLDIMEMIKKVWDNQDITVQIQISQLIPILVHRLPDDMAEHIPNIIQFAMNNIQMALSPTTTPEVQELILSSISIILKTRSQIDDFYFIIIPEFVKAATRANNEKIIIAILQALTLLISDSNYTAAFSTQIIQCCLTISARKAQILQNSVKELLFAISLKVGTQALLRFQNPIIEESLKEKRICRKMPHSRTSSAMLHKSQSQFCEQKLVDGFSGNELFSNKHILLTIQLSPYLYVSECYQIASKMPSVGVKLFFISFLSCWSAITKEAQDSILNFLIKSLTDKKEAPELVSILCSLFEFLEKWEIEFDPDTCLSISKTCLNSWHLAKAIYFAHRAYYRRTVKRTEDIDWLIALSAKMGLDKTVNGLLLLMKKYESSPTCYEQLGMWKEAQILYENETDCDKKFIGKIKCLWHQLLYDDILTKENLDYFSAHVEKCARTSIYFASAVIKKDLLISFSRIHELIPYLPEDSIRGIVIKAVWNMFNQNKDGALAEVEKGYKILASRLNDKDMMYPLLMKAQQLHELSEMITCKREDLKDIWQVRLSRCRETFDVYNSIISNRLQMFNAYDMVMEISKMLQCALENGQLEFFDRSMSQLFPDRTNFPVQIRFISCQRIWAEGKKAQAITALKNLIKSNLFSLFNDLRARANFTCGNWMLLWKQSNPDIAPGAEEAIPYLEEAIKIDQCYYRAWHRWSWACSSMFFAAPKITKHAENAIKGFLSCVRLKEGDSFSDLIQSIYLIFLPSIDEKTFESITPLINNLDDRALLTVLPQMFSQLNRARPYVVDFVGKIISRLLVQHFHVVFYPLMFYQTEPLFNKTASDIRQLFAKRQPIGAAEGVIVHEGLIRCSQSIPEKWKEYVAMAFHHLKEKDFSKAEILLKEASTFGAPLRDTMFMREFRSRLDRTATRINESKELTDDITKDVQELYISIRRNVASTRQLDVAKCAPRLASLHTTVLSVPGTYSIGAPIIKIAQVDTKMLVYRSKQRPRNIKIIGSDGSINKSLLKGSEDLRLDQRVMQFFDLINQHTQHDWRNSKLKIFVYSITPLSKTSGLIQFVNGADTLFSLVHEYRSQRGKTVFLEREMIGEICDCPADSLLPVQRREILAEVTENTPDTDLREILWQRSPSSREWVSRTTIFAQSSALMSIIGYMLGLGDRHPSNLMIHRYSGSVIHIDFSDCFEITRDRVKFPELVPFRLTRMMISALGPSGIEGNFRATCVQTVALVRSHRDSIVAVLEAKHAEDKGEACEPSSASAAAPANVAEPDIPEEYPSEQDDFSFDQTGSPHGQNVDIMARLRDKIAGCDFSDKNLTPDQQVSELIRSATDPYNMSFLYQGWTPLW